MTDWIITLSLSTIMHAAVRSGSNSKYYVCITFWNAQYMSKVTPGSHLVASLPSNKSNISFSFFLLLKEFLKYEKNKINRGMYDSKNRISTNRIWSKTGYLKKKQNKKTSRTSDSQKVVGNKLYKKYYVYKYRA